MDECTPGNATTVLPDVHASTDKTLDDFVEKCAAAYSAAKSDGGGEKRLGQGRPAKDMVFEDFVWSQEFAEQGFDPLFMMGMTADEAERARKEWVTRIMDGDDDVDELSEHYKNEGNRIVNEARKLKAEGNENYTKLHAAAIQMYTAALCQNASSVVLRAVCHANRANSHLERSNFGHAIRDCNATLGILDAVTNTAGGVAVWVAGRQARGVVKEEEEMLQLLRVGAKSAARAARASLRLKRFDTGNELNLCMYANETSVCMLTKPLYAPPPRSASFLRARPPPAPKPLYVCKLNLCMRIN